MAKKLQMEMTLWCVNVISNINFQDLWLDQDHDINLTLSVMESEMELDWWGGGGWLHQLLQGVLKKLDFRISAFYGFSCDLWAF